MSGYCGRGEAMGHVGEILQGALGGEPFLVSLPAPWLRSVVTVRSAEAWTVTPADRTKALRAAQLASVSGAFAVAVESEVPVGRGCGSSTADCVAAVRAMRPELGAAAVAAIVVAAEAACDGTMFGLQPVAFFPRRGRVLKVLGEAWPAMGVRMVDLGGATVDTLGLERIRYTAAEMGEFGALLQELETAVRSGDGRGVAAVATRSAEIHQQYRPHAGFEAFRREAMAAGAWGGAVAHSGTVAAALGELG